jgi:DNA-binding GntR family transcriptional regulator
MTGPGTFERVYAAIKQRLRDGFYKPGDRLEPAALSDELNASVTPVRDALHRLAGERLVEAPRHEGFRVPMLTESMLRQLYSWHRDLLLLALMNHRQELVADRHGAAQPTPDAPARERQKALFFALVRSTGNSEHVAALESLSDRLAPVEQLADALLDAAEAEASEIMDALRANDRKALRRSLVRYHRRREKIVPELIAALVDARNRD